MVGSQEDRLWLFGDSAWIQGGCRAQRQMHTQQAEDTGTWADISLGNVSHECLELEWIQAYLQYLEVFIFLVFLSNVSLKHGTTKKLLRFL